MKKTILENKKVSKKKKKQVKKTKDIRIFNFLSFILIFSGFLLLAYFFYNYFIFYKNINNGTKETEVNEDEEVECNYRRIIDGVCVDFQKDVNPDLVVVMIENHTDARPQSGLEKANIVYEAPVEANYSRFMAIYLKDDEVVKVGPIRSARPYYLDWLSEYGKPLYIHIGGAPLALERIKNENIFDMNEFYRGSYFWRSSDRYAPHNAYSSSNLWQADWKKYSDENIKMNTSSWQFGDIENCEENCINNVYISFLDPYYTVDWKYSSSTEKYLRYQVGYKHLVQDGSKIFADIIIVQYVNTKVIDEVGRLEMDTFGTGKVEIFQKGNKVFGFWQKDDLNLKTRFYNENNEEIILNSGKIWIEVVNQNCDVKDY